MKAVNKELKEQLDQLVEFFECPHFISDDPISIPHQFTTREDIEIAGFFSAIFAWGQRKTIINKARVFVSLMDNQPFDFILNFQPKDLRRFSSFKHRTFQADDAISFMYFFQSFYRENKTLESIFTGVKGDNMIEQGLNKLYTMFIQHPASIKRSLKHLPSPARGSACKRLNMFLRWMVRNSERGVDFGLWKQVNAADLIIPLDTHVYKTAIDLGLIDAGKTNWKMAVELTNVLRSMDASDPVKYDFALFSMSLQKRLSGI